MSYSKVLSNIRLRFIFVINDNVNILIRRIPLKYRKFKQYQMNFQTFYLLQNKNLSKWKAIEVRSFIIHFFQTSRRSILRIITPHSHTKVRLLLKRLSGRHVIYFKKLCLIKELVFVWVNYHLLSKNTTKPFTTQWKWYRLKPPK